MSIESDFDEVLFNDHVSDSVEYELDVGGVGGAGEVRIDLLDPARPSPVRRARLVQALEAHLNVRAGVLESIRACTQFQVILTLYIIRIRMIRVLIL